MRTLETLETKGGNCSTHSSTPSCPQNIGHDLSIISEEIEALDEIINQSLQCITQDNPKECVSIETQTCDVSSAE